VIARAARGWIARSTTELRFHVEEEIEAGVRRGLTAEEARRAAHASLGGAPLRVREQIHDARQLSPLDDLWQDLRHGARLLRRSPAFTLVVTATLAIAIGAVVTVFSITDAWLFRPLRFPHPDRLVVAFAASPSTPGEPAVWMPYRAYLSWRDSVRTLSSVSAAFFQGLTWRTSSGAKSIVAMRVSPEFFTTLGVTPLHGRTLSASDVSGPPALVVGYGFWQCELGGAETVLGTKVTLSEVPYTVVGVMPADFDVRLLDQPEGADVWTLLQAGERGYGPGGAGPVAILGRLADGVPIEAAREEAAAVMHQAESAYPRNFNDFVVNLSSLQADNTRTVRATLVTVLASALCLLAIASTNVGVLLLGRGLARRGEVAVRHALGASRARLMGQFLAESLAISVCGGALGTGLAVVGIRLFVAWNPLGTLPANAAQLDRRALAAAMLATGLSAIVAGLVPASRMSAAGPAAALRYADRGRPDDAVVVAVRDQPRSCGDRRLWARRPGRRRAPPRDCHTHRDWRTPLQRDRDVHSRGIGCRCGRPRARDWLGDGARAHPRIAALRRPRRRRPIDGRCRLAAPGCSRLRCMGAGSACHAHRRRAGTARVT
jgi:hypothetical protein